MPQQPAHPRPDEAPAPTRREAFETLLTPILDAAYGLAVHFARDHADAEDLLQEAALLAFRHFSTFRPGTNFRAWFLRILTNVFFARRRKERRRPSSVELADVPELYLYTRTAEAGLHGAAADPARLLLERLTAEQVERAIDALPDEYRVVCALYLLEDVKYSEIAALLELPVGTVRSRLHRGRRILQRLLWKVAEEDGIVASLANGRLAG